MRYRVENSEVLSHCWGKSSPWINMLLSHPKKQDLKDQTVSKKRNCISKQNSRIFTEIQKCLAPNNDCHPTRDYQASKEEWKSHLYLVGKKKKINQSTEMNLEPTQMFEIVDKDIYKS